MTISGTISSLNINGNVTTNNVTGKLNIPQVSGSITYSPTIIVNPYGPEATALFNRMAIQPSTALKQLIDKTISDLKTAGIWQITDKLHKWDLHTEQASLLDWKNPAHNAVQNGTSVSYYPSDGVYTSGTAYIDLSFIPETDFIYGTQDNVAYGLDDTTNVAVAGPNFGSVNTSNTSSFLFRTFQSVDTTYFRPWIWINSGLQTVWNSRPKADTYSWLVNRTQAEGFRAYTSPSVTTGYRASQSVTPSNQSLLLGAYMAYTGVPVRAPINTSLLWIGAGLTDEQITAYYTIMQYWKDNIAIALTDLYGAEMIVNGTFDTDTKWSKGAGVSIENGKAVFNNASVGAGINQGIGMQEGKTYRIEFTVSDYVSGNAMIYFYGSNQYGVSRLGNGRFVQHITATANVGNFSIITSGSGTFKIDNVSVKELL